MKFIVSGHWFVRSVQLKLQSGFLVHDFIVLNFKVYVFYSYKVIGCNFL